MKKHRLFLTGSKAELKKYAQSTSTVFVEEEVGWKDNH